MTFAPEMMSMHKAFLLIGGNEGDRFAHLARARANIELICGQELDASSLYATSAWGLREQPDFLNQVLLTGTEMKPEALLSAILGIETEMGRIRAARYGPRIIDIDILFFDQLLLDIPGLQIPHPRIAERRFVLEPLAEIAPGLVHPVSHLSVAELLRRCTDPLEVKKI